MTVTRGQVLCSFSFLTLTYYVVRLRSTVMARTMTHSSLSLSLQALTVHMMVVVGDQQGDLRAFPRGTVWSNEISECVPLLSQS